ncbi:MAG: GNAT family N-acetyltransferase [Clostridia bacterium]|nr:GNAT family N-acetyltransferase [Clostridia bacterium]MBT7122219.1 GNAT family N-acetyltransferase [Clostridia bacterium]
MRLWQESDFDDFHEVMSNELTHTHTGEDAWSAEQTKGMIRWNMENTDIGSGYFNLPLVLLDTNKVIGRVGLNPYLEEKRIPEIEWTVNPQYWNKGYATQIAREMLGFAFEKAGFGEVVGIVKDTNTGSVRVLEKIGAQFEARKLFRGEEWDFYSMKSG